MNLMKHCYHLRDSPFQVSFFYLFGSKGKMIEKNPVAKVLEEALVFHDRELGIPSEGRNHGCFSCKEIQRQRCAD